MRQVEEVFEAEKSVEVSRQGALFALGFEDLELHRSVDSVVIFCRGFCIFTFAPADQFSRNYGIVQLHLAGRIKLKSLSKLFGLSYPYCSRLLSRYRLRGVEGLKEESTTLFVANKKSWSDPWKREKMENLVMLLQGAIQAEEKVGLKMNVPKKSLKAVLSKLPALHAPTVSQQSDEAWVALEVIVDEKIVREIIPALKRAGASGLVEYPLNKVID